MVAVLVVVLVILAVISGYVTDSTRKMTRKTTDTNKDDEIAYKYGIYASITGWITIGLIILACVGIGFFPEVFIYGSSFVTYGLFGFMIIACGITGALALYSASKVKTGNSYEANKTIYTKLIGAGIGGILMVAVVIAIFLYQIISKYMKKHKNDKINGMIDQYVAAKRSEKIHAARADAASRKQAADYSRQMADYEKQLQQQIRIQSLQQQLGSVPGPAAVAPAAVAVAPAAAAPTLTRASQSYPLVTAASSAARATQPGPMVVQAVPPEVPVSQAQLSAYESW